MYLSNFYLGLQTRSYLIMLKLMHPAEICMYSVGQSFAAVAHE